MMVLRLICAVRSYLRKLRSLLQNLTKDNTDSRLSDLESFVAYQINKHTKAYRGLDKILDVGFDSLKGFEWSKVNGDSKEWDENDFVRGRRGCMHDDKLHVALSAQILRGSKIRRIEIWKLESAGNWVCIADWQTFGFEKSMRKDVTIHDLVSDGDNLYAALGDAVAEVWKYNGQEWEILGGRGAGWDCDHYSRCGCLAWDGNALYVGMHSKKLPASVFMFKKNKWSNLLEGHGNQNLFKSSAGIYSICLDEKGVLYAGDFRKHGLAMVWRYDGTWSSLENINGGSNFAYQPVSLFNGLLALGRHVFSVHNVSEYSQGISPISIFGDDGISNIPLDDSDPFIKNFEFNNSNAICVFQNLLFIGVGGTKLGNAGVFAIDGMMKWKSIGGKGIRASWSKNGSPLALSPHNGYEIIYDFVVDPNTQELYVLFGTRPGLGQVWRLSAQKNYTN